MTTKNKNYKSAYEAAEKIMLTLRETNYSLALENRNLKLRLAVYEPEPIPAKEAEFMEAIREVMYATG